MNPGRLLSLPANLPRPEDDGRARHLTAMALPNLTLPATTGGEIALDSLGQKGRAVLFCYPMTGRPGVNLPDGWDDIPGARGCTPQACSFRDLHASFAALGASILGLSTQEPGYQRELAERLHLTYPVLSDQELAFVSAMQLPTLSVDGMTLIKRLTMVIRDGVVEKVFYPVFPPDRATDDVLAWLKALPEEHIA